MAVQDDALAAWTQMQQGPGNEYVRQQERGDPLTAGYSPHQLLTGGGVPRRAELQDPSAVHGPTPGQAPDGPAVEPVPNQTAAHAGTNTLGRKDA